MRITVKAKAGSKKTFIRQEATGEFTVAVHERAVDGQANEAIVQELAGFFDVAPSRISLVRGHTAKTKLFEIN